MIDFKKQSEKEIAKRMCMYIVRVEELQENILKVLKGEDGGNARKALNDYSILKLEIANAGIEYLGTLDGNYNFVGVIKQSGEVFPVVLTTDKTAKR